MLNGKSVLCHAHLPGSRLRRPGEWLYQKTLTAPNARASQFAALPAIPPGPPFVPRTPALSTATRLTIHLCRPTFSVGRRGGFLIVRKGIFGSMSLPLAWLGCIVLLPLSAGGQMQAHPARPS